MTDLILRLETEQEYREARSRLETWVADDDIPAPPFIENLINAIVKYEEKHFPMEWEDETP